MSKAMARMVVLAVVGSALVGCASNSSLMNTGLDESARQYLADAHRYLKHGLTDSALASFGLALEENSHLTAAHLGMGNIYRKRGQYQFARDAYKQAVVDDPTNFDARYYLGLMQQALGHLQKAVTSYLAALSIKPGSARANRDLAAAYLQLGDSQRAVPYAAKAAKLNPQNQSAWANLGAAYSLIGEYRKAVSAYRHALELGPISNPLLLGLADAHIQLGHYQRAINVLDDLIRRHPTALAHERRGFTMFKLHRYDAALKDYQAALKLAPKDPAAMNGVGVCLMTLYIKGDREDQTERNRALALWRKSVRLDPNQPHITDLISRYDKM